MNHDVAVNRLTENEAKAIVLSLRMLLSFGEQTHLSYRHLCNIAYLRDPGTAACREAMDTP